MKESALKRKVLEAYRARGAWAVKIHGSPYQEAGIPDIVACYHGRLVAPELKVGKNKATPAQLAQMAKIRAAGGTSREVYTLEEALDLLAEAANT